MLKKTITYTDYDGLERTEDFYFNLTRAEVAQMELSINGGMKKFLENIIQLDDRPKIIEEFKKLITMSYGKKSPDGKRFIKSQELAEEFTQTEAFSDLFMELATNAVSASEFVKGILPKNMGDFANQPGLTPIS